MAKFCPSCGSSCKNEAGFCPACGAALPAAPARNNGRKLPASGGSFPTLVKRNIQIITAVIALFGLLTGVLNLFGLYDVKLSVSGLGSMEVALSTVRKDESGTMLLFVLSGYLMGVTGLATALLSGYSAFLRMKRANGARKFLHYAALVGTAGAALAIVLALLGGSMEQSGVKASLSIHFTYWISLILNGFLFYIDKVVLKKKRRVVK